MESGLRHQVSGVGRHDEYSNAESAEFNIKVPVVEMAERRVRFILHQLGE